MIQEVFSTYPKPYILTYLTTSLFSFYLLAFIPGGKCKSFKYYLFQSFKFCPLWFFANYFFNISLNMTSVASNTILASTSGIFTLLFSIIFLKSSSDLLKWTAVLMSFVGIVCIGLCEGDSEGESIVGDLFAVFGAIVYSAYSVALKSVENSETVFVFGCIGIVNFFTLMPGLVLLNFLGIEQVEIPEVREVSIIFVNAVVGSMACDLFWAWSVDYLTPTVCTLGLTFTIPISMAVDKYWKNTEFGAGYLVGAALVVFGFVLISLADEGEKNVQEKVESQGLMIEEEEI
jgi:solute carrier family 35 protein F5